MAAARYGADSATCHLTGSFDAPICDVNFASLSSTNASQLSLQLLTFRWAGTGLARASGEMGSILEIVLIGIFAVTVAAAAATVLSRVVHQAHGTGYP
jgi:hypothetical protein